MNIILGLTRLAGSEPEASELELVIAEALLASFAFEDARVVFNGSRKYSDAERMDALLDRSRELHLSLLKVRQRLDDRNGRSYDADAVNEVVWAASIDRFNRLFAEIKKSGPWMDSEKVAKAMREITNQMENRND